MIKTKKKILYIHQYFITPKKPGGTRSYWIAKKMIDNGFHVTMLTSDTNPKSIKVRRVNEDGIDVIYIPNPYNNNMGLINRLFSFFKFMLIGSFYALKEKDVDLVFATSTPLTVGIPALIKKWFQKIDYVFEVRDLWPEVPIQMGALNNFIVRKMALKLEELVYKNARHVIALSPGMEKGVLRYRFMEGKTSMIPNMSKPDIFYPRKIDSTILHEFKLNTSNFNIVHFGAMGIANGLDYIINAAEELTIKNDKSIQFHFFGAGRVEGELKELKRKKKLSNVHFHGAHPMNILSEFVNVCDVSLVTFKDLPILKTNSPNKLFDSLSAGKPIIVNSSGWTKDLVEEYNCGLYVDPKKPKELVEKLLFLQMNEPLRKQMGENSRKISLLLYDKELLSSKVFDSLNRFV